MSITVMKQALEAFEAPSPMRQYNAITSLRQAIAEAEKQEPVAWLVEFENGEQELHFEEQSVGATHTPLYTYLPNAKPVAWMDIDGNVSDNNDYNCFPIPLYTTPQRQWRGLTPQERDEINKQVYGAVPHHVAFHHAIEAKLKELNT